jgi:hypothetical protein
MKNIADRESRVRTFVDEVWNGRNYEAAADLYGEKYRSPFGVGPSARIEPIRRYREAFPDLHLDVEDLIVAGDTGTGVGPRRPTMGHLGTIPWQPGCRSGFPLVSFVTGSSGFGSHIGSGCMPRGT